MCPKNRAIDKWHIPHYRLAWTIKNFFEHEKLEQDEKSQISFLRNVYDRMQIKQTQIVFQTDLDFPLRVTAVQQLPSPVHKHQFTEIVFITGGNGIHVTKFGQQNISRGDILVIPENAYHRYLEVDNLELINLMFKPDRLPIPLMDLYKLDGFNALFCFCNEHFEKNQYYPRLHLSAGVFDKLDWILTEMRGESSLLNPGCRCSLMGYFMVLMSNLSRLYSDSYNKDNALPKQIGQVLGYLNAHYKENIQLEEIIRNFPVSRSTFMRNFQKAVGMSPIQFLINVRIKQACILLRQSQMNISEVAFQSGYQDSNYFTRQFSKITKMTPSQFRKKYTTVPV